jgi:hypothetical protein
LHPLPLGVRPLPIGAGCFASPDSQLRPPDETAAVGGRQLASRLGERLICHHDRLITTVMQCTRNNLLYSGYTHSLCQPLTLDRHAGAVFLGDQIHPVVTATSGASDAPTPGSKLCRNEFLKLDTRHLVDSCHSGRHAFKVAFSL